MVNVRLDVAKIQDTALGVPLERQAAEHRVRAVLKSLSSAISHGTELSP